MNSFINKESRTGKRLFLHNDENSLNKALLGKTESERVHNTYSVNLVNS